MKSPPQLQLMISLFHSKQDKAQLDMFVLLAMEEVNKNMHAEYDLHVENIQKTLSILFFSTRIISWGCGLK